MPLGMEIPFEIHPPQPPFPEASAHVTSSVLSYPVL
jgi:hypothetical protein